MLYDRYPTLPGGTDHTTGNPQGSDISAVLWAFVPYTAAQHRAVFEDHEPPFWNRYNAGGQPLLGQGQSMIGDPLHWLVLLGGADAGMWDLKFLLAKLLFAAGVGLLVRTATGHPPTALLLAFSSCFLGVFTYRFDHPAFFGVCYAPWILLAWLEIARAGATPRWLGLLLLADWCEMNSGTVKEAFMLLPALNAGGLLTLALSDTLPWRRKGRALLAVACAGACFVLVSAPVWWTLFDTLRHAWSGYDAPPVWQLQPGLLAGLFDDIFYRQFTDHEHVLDPSANFVVLLGVALAAGAWKPLVRRERTFLAAGLSAAAAAALAFGVVSPGVIRAVPFLGSVSHCDNTFSLVLILFLLIVAGHGLAYAWRRFGARDWPLDVAAAAVVLAVLVGAFLGLTQAAQRSAVNFLPVEHDRAHKRIFPGGRGRAGGGRFCCCHGCCGGSVWTGGGARWASRRGSCSRWARCCGVRDCTCRWHPAWTDTRWCQWLARVFTDARRRWISCVRGPVVNRHARKASETTSCLAWVRCSAWKRPAGRTGCNSPPTTN